MRVRLLCASLLAAASYGCQAFLDTDAEKGIGAQCTKDAECQGQGATCVKSVCAFECESQDDCPEGTVCQPGPPEVGKTLCQLPLKVAFIVPPEGADQDWTTAHTTGAQAAMSSLSYAVAQVFPGADAGNVPGIISQALGEGFQAIFAASPDFNAAMIEAAKANPGAEFFTCLGGGGMVGNHHGYYGNLFDAWYIAGKIAGAKSTTKRIGIVGSVVTPAVIRDINAFALGARSLNPNPEDNPTATVKVEVTWLHDWYDRMPGGEDDDRILAGALVANGCDVIAYTGYKRSAASKVKDLDDPDVFLIGNNLESTCDAPEQIPRCVATVYWNWAPLYGYMVDLLHTQQLPPGGQGFNSDIKADAAASVPNIKASDPADQEIVNTDRATLSAGAGAAPVFTAGAFQYCTNGGQRLVGGMPVACVDPGTTIADGELGTMCWFVDNVIDAVDMPALVPAEAGCPGG